MRAIVFLLGLISTASAQAETLSCFASFPSGGDAQSTRSPGVVKISGAGAVLIASADQFGTITAMQIKDDLTGLYVASRSSVRMNNGSVSNSNYSTLTLNLPRGQFDFECIVNP